jgi:hypothetical protein
MQTGFQPRLIRVATFRGQAGLRQTQTPQRPTQALETETTHLASKEGDEGQPKIAASLPHPARSLCRRIFAWPIPRSAMSPTSSNSTSIVWEMTYLLAQPACDRCFFISVESSSHLATEYGKVSDDRTQGHRTVFEAGFSASGTSF